MKEKYTLKDSKTQRDVDSTFKTEMEKHFLASKGTVIDKLNNFPRFVPRQAMSLFLAKNEMFKKITHIHGAIVEAGVFMGGGLFTWSQLSAIYEPINYNRKVIGFDSFAGFPSISEADETSGNEHLKVGGYSFDGEQELQVAADLHNLTRPLGHIANVELVKGTAEETIPQFVQNNPHVVVALLYLDFDLYEPTKIAIESFLPRMPKGAVIAFDELNQKNWPGETMAVLDTIGIRELKIERFDFTPSISYAILD